MISKIFWSLFVFCLQIIIGVCISIAVVLMVPFLICRLLISYLSVLRPDLDEILILRDAVHLTKNFQKNPIMVVFVKIVVKGRMSAEYVKDQFEKKIFVKNLNTGQKNGYSRLQQYPYSWMGYFFWKWEENFNINDHVQEYTCEKLTNYPNYIFSEEELREIDNSILQKPFPQNKSLWDMTLLSKGNSDSGEAETVAYFRSNHAMGDGYALIQLLSKIFADETSEKQIEENSKLGLISLKSKFAILIKTILFGFHDLTKTLAKIRIGKLFKILYSTNNENILYFESKLIPMEILKEVSKIHNVGVSAVIYSALALGLQKALMKNTGYVPKTLIAYFPLPMCDRPMRFTNHTAFGIITLPVGELDSLKRLKMIHRNISRAKTSTYPFILFYLCPLMCAPFSFITQYYLDPRFTPLVFATTIPYFKTKVGKDYQMQKVNFSATLRLVDINNPIGFNSITYNNKLQFVVNGHNAIFNIQDLEDITHFIEEEFEKPKGLKL